MTSWTTHATTDATPEQVLEVLTDPQAIRMWSPIPFELDTLAGDRLEAGSEARVSGSLAGLRVGFGVAVHAADADGLELTAKGPIALDVRYDLAPRAQGSDITASVSVRPTRGITGRMIGGATTALLAAGALEGAAARIACAAETTRPQAMAA
ncbi:MAG TPA: SRPBCC family protein [Solirubrobacteraceae bacterium]|nr:SRPBCC family protein [Solirubrobacteraceae bacterium]